MRSSRLLEKPKSLTLGEDRWSKRRERAFDRDYGDPRAVQDVWRQPEPVEPDGTDDGTAPKLWVPPVVVMAVVAIVLLAV